MSSQTHDTPKTYMDLQEMKPIANQFSARHSNLLYPFQQVYIIKVYFQVISRKISNRLTLIAVFLPQTDLLLHLPQLRMLQKKLRYDKEMNSDNPRGEERYKTVRQEQESLAIQNVLSDANNSEILNINKGGRHCIHETVESDTY